MQSCFLYKFNIACEKPGFRNKLDAQTVLHIGQNGQMNDTLAKKLTQAV